MKNIQKSFYKVTKKLLNSDMLKKIFIEPAEEDETKTYSKQVQFAKDSPIVNSMVGYLNNKKWQMNAGVYDEQQRKSLAEQGLIFKEKFVTADDGTELTDGFEVVPTDELLEELGIGLVMFEGTGEYKNIIHIGSQSDTYPFVYFDSNIIDRHCGELMKELKKEGLIRKVVVKAKEEVGQA